MTTFSIFIIITQYRCLFAIVARQTEQKRSPQLEAEDKRTMHDCRSAGCIGYKSFDGRNSGVYYLPFRFSARCRACLLAGFLGGAKTSKLHHFRQYKAETAGPIDGESQ
jgi:hypothetical protein